MLSLRSRLNALTEVSDNEQMDDEDNLSPEEVTAKQDRKRARKRKKIVRELFETEKAYIHHLELVHKHFDFPLRFACIINENVHQKLFSNIEQILEVNRQLLEELEHSTVGLAFLHLGPFLKLYSTYANNHEQALTTLQEWQHKSVDFVKFLELQEGRPEVRGLKLNALLITPVQRVPRYQMLLEDLLEHTSPEHHDYNNLTEATQQVKGVAWHINEHIRQHENFQKMLDIQNKLVGSAPKILAPGRLFIKEGCLKKVSRKGGRAYERMFFLFSDMLVYAKPKLLDSGKNSYTCCCVLPLKHCKVEPVFDRARKGQEGGMFRVSCDNESLLLYSTVPGYIDEWVEELVTAVRRFNKNRRTLRKPSSNKTPLRGLELAKQKKSDQKSNTPRKRALESVQEEEVAQTESPCIKDSLHPMRLQVSALCELDLTNCLSPRKRARTHIEAPPQIITMDSLHKLSPPHIHPDPDRARTSQTEDKLSITLGSMEFTDDGLNADNMDISVDFLGGYSDHHRYSRPALHSNGFDNVLFTGNSSVDENVDGDTAIKCYSSVFNRLKKNRGVVEAAADVCAVGLQSAYEQLKSPVTNRCVIL